PTTSATAAAASRWAGRHGPGSSTATGVRASPVARPLAARGVHATWRKGYQRERAVPCEELGLQAVVEPAHAGEACQGLGNAARIRHRLLAWLHGHHAVARLDPQLRGVAFPQALDEAL